MNQQQTEQLRWAALEYLACRSTCAFSSDQVKRGLDANGVNHMIGIPLDPASVSAALAFLAGDGLASPVQEPMGATRYYQATSAGVRAWERKRLDQEG